MPIKPAAFKALRQNIKAHDRNQIVKRNLKKMAVNLRKAYVVKDLAEAKTIVTQYVAALDRAAQKKILHRNTAARKKSRLLAALKKQAA